MDEIHQLLRFLEMYEKKSKSPEWKLEKTDQKYEESTVMEMKKKSKAINITPFSRCLCDGCGVADGFIEPREMLPVRYKDAGCRGNVRRKNHNLKNFARRK